MKKIIKKIILLNKKEAETPLEALENFRKKNPQYLGVPMTYAGRLDPMASGALLILAGEETKNKEKYLNKDKEYEFEVLFGFSTDTFDILGKITNCVRQDLTQQINLRYSVDVKNLEKEIKKNIKSFVGESIQKYPMYSSKTVKGKPLFVYARNGEDVDIPERKIFIYKLKLEKIRTINSKKLFKNIEKRIKKVKGDFRQDEILKIWKDNLNFKDFRFKKFYIAKLKIKCSSGTYVRNIAHSLGKKLNIPSLAFSIKRTKIC